MAEKDWVKDAVMEFRKGCKELQDELSKTATGTLLDVSDEQIMKNPGFKVVTFLSISFLV